MCKKLIASVLSLCSISSIHAASFDDVYVKEFSYETAGGNSGLMFLTLVKADGGMVGSELNNYINFSTDNFDFISMSYLARLPLHVDYDSKNGFKKITAINTID
ncbi:MULTISPECIES: hypothetical protein [Enterobacterales]|uniref:hypothetical protein n=1 Tax=Enterobacterales TaxID=91347 RepID=UPI0021D3DF30|nr:MULTISPECIES: hypothetical protein [Enterobacterales]MCU6211024.1 hypothetical protein [Morganella morganii]